MALKTMTIPKLQDLKSQVEAVISAKVTERRRELETELFQAWWLYRRGKTRKPTGKQGRMGPVAPKYRNPENPAETWAGRGLKPRWLTAAIKGGKKLEDFAIDEALKGFRGQAAEKDPEDAEAKEIARPTSCPTHQRTM